MIWIRLVLHRRDYWMSTLKGSRGCANFEEDDC